MDPQSFTTRVHKVGRYVVLIAKSGKVRVDVEPGRIIITPIDEVRQEQRAEYVFKGAGSGTSMDFSSIM
jgi:hypothetical protein